MLATTLQALPKSKQRLQPSATLQAKTKDLQQYSSQSDACSEGASCWTPQHSQALVRNLVCRNAGGHQARPTCLHNDFCDVAKHSKTHVHGASKLCETTKSGKTIHVGSTVCSSITHVSVSHVGLASWPPALAEMRFLAIVRYLTSLKVTGAMKGEPRGGGL